jgi:hypothetical protein
MKISELLKTFDELTGETVDTSSAYETPEKHDDDVDTILVLSGIGKATTEPHEHYFPLSSAYPAGDDVHHSKNPADMRSDSVSLYPGYGATK